MKFRCTREVVAAAGDQEFEVEAETLAEARGLFGSGAGTMVADDSEITDLGEYELDSIWEAESEPPTTVWRDIATAPKDGTEVVLRAKILPGMPGKCLVGHYMAGGHCVEDHPPIDAGWYFYNGCAFGIATVAALDAWAPLPTDEETAG